MDEEIKPSLNNILMNIFNQIINMKYRKRKICLAFMSLPDRDNYPDYYKTIKIPISLDLILKKIKTGYGNFNQFEKDIEQLCKNAQAYNEENSIIFKDSIRIFVKTLLKLE
jgi:hypothetical protein